jgi:hypothetical protein
MLQRALDPVQNLNMDRLPPSTSFALKIVKAIYKEQHEQINLWHGHTAHIQYRCKTQEYGNSDTQTKER